MSENLARTQVTPLIRVSTAAIDYEEPFPREQLETWIFSDDPRQRSRQIIHRRGRADAVRVHRHIASNLLARFSACPAPLTSP